MSQAESRGASYSSSERFISVLKLVEVIYIIIWFLSKTIFHNKIKMHLQALHINANYLINANALPHILLFWWTWQGASKFLTYLAVAPQCGQCENILKERFSTIFQFLCACISQLGINSLVHSLLSHQERLQANVIY